jgi:hypothetical protein
MFGQPFECYLYMSCERANDVIKVLEGLVIYCDNIHDCAKVTRCYFGVAADRIVI